MRAQAESWMHFLFLITGTLGGLNGGANHQVCMSDTCKFTRDDSLGRVFGVR